MAINWGPKFIVPSEALKNYSGMVLLRENLDEDLLREELEELGFPTSIARITNPWYYRKKDASTWIKIGESDNRSENFPVSWDTRVLKNGEYEVQGLMHVFVRGGNVEKAIARQNVVKITIQN